VNQLMFHLSKLDLPADNQEGESTDIGNGEKGDHDVETIQDTANDYFGQLHRIPQSI
jgi:hypothetical protein